MKKKTVFVIGDSISIHYGPFLEKYLRGRFGYSRKGGEEAAMADLDHPAGANGGDSSMVLGYLSGNGVHHEIPHSDYLLVNCGLHDIKTDPATGKKQVPINQYEENLRGIIAHSETLCDKLVWVNTTPCDEEKHNKPGMGFHRFSRDCREYNETASKVMKAKGVPLIDLNGFTLNLGNGLYCDHVHFNEDVRQKQAAFIAGWLYRDMEIAED